MSAAADAGLITLEWLLIVGAVAGLAAFSVLAVQRVIDDTSEVPADPLVRLLEADIAAAFVASDAQADFDADAAGYVDGNFSSRCNDIQSDFSDVVSGVPMPMWTTPSLGPDGMPGTNDDEPAKCVVTPRSGLGG